MSQDDQPEDNGGGDIKDQASEEGNLYVTDSGGDGTPVVLIHGWPLSQGSWSAQRSALVDAGYRVVAYDRRGFGRSGPGDGYDYDKLAGDLDNTMNELDLHDAVLVGFSMGGGEVARYVGSHGEDRLRGVVFAAAIPPALVASEENPDGPLDPEAAQGMRQALEDDREAFFEEFTTNFFSAGDTMVASDDQREQALAVAKRSDERAALECMDAWATDFRRDLEAVTVPTLVIHGDQDAIVPLEGSGKRTHEAVSGSRLVVIEGGPHGVNVTHAEEFNEALLGFLAEIGDDDSSEDRSGD